MSMEMLQRKIVRKHDRFTNTNLERAVMNIKGGQLRRMRDALEQHSYDVRTKEDRYLRQNGWELTCKTPGSVWMWTKALPDGRVVLVPRSTALDWTEGEEIDQNNSRSWVEGELCPECDQPMSLDPGEPGGQDEPPREGCIFCDDCGLDFKIDHSRQAQAS